MPIRPYENEWTTLLGKIMAQILIILALSTRAMKEGRISQSIHTPDASSLIDRASEKFAKRLIGRADVEDAFLSIDMLTKDETIMAVAKTLEVVFDIHGNIEGLRADVESANAHVQAMSQNLEAMNKGRQGVLSNPVHILTVSPLYTIGMNESQRLSPLYSAIIDRKKLTHTHRGPVVRETSEMAFSPRSFHQS